MDRVLHGSTRGTAGTEDEPRAGQGGRHTPSQGTGTIHQPDGMRGRSRRHRAAAGTEQSTEPISTRAAQGWGQRVLGRVCQDPSAEPSPSSASTNGRGTDLMSAVTDPSKGHVRARLVSASGQSGRGAGAICVPHADMKVQR